MKYDLENIENAISKMSNSEKEFYLNNLIYETEKKLIETHKNSFEFLKSKTQNDYIKYLDAFDNDKLIYWYNDKGNEFLKNLNEKTALRIGIENHVLLRKRLKIDNEIESLNDRLKLLKNLLENKKIAMNKINHTGMKIKRLNVDVMSLPSKIYNRFCFFGDYNNIFNTKTQPFLLEINYVDCNFFIINEMQFELFKLYKYENEIDLLSAYGSGFHKGYFEFIDTLNTNELFERSDKSVAYKVFSRTNVGWFSGKSSGNLLFIDMDFKNNKIGDCDLFFNEGIKGGEFYKAWEIILSEPMQFLEFFESNINATAIQPSQENDSDTNEKTLHGKNMNLDLLNDLFIPEMTRGNKPTKLDQLKEDLRANVCIYKAYQITALASIIYKNGTLHKNTKPHNFIDWLKMFCEIIDYPTITNYKQSNKQVKNEILTLKNTYFYFIP